MAPAAINFPLLASGPVSLTSASTIQCIVSGASFFLVQCHLLWHQPYLVNSVKGFYYHGKKQNRTNQQTTSQQTTKHNKPTNKTKNQQKQNKTRQNKNPYSLSLKEIIEGSQIRNVETEF